VTAPSPLFAKALARAEEYMAEGCALFEEDARRSIAEADGSYTVYFIQENGIDAIKIGVTGDLQQRLSSMRVNTPHELEMLVEIDADTRLEKYLQRRFAYAHIRGEWFRPVPELIKCIGKCDAETLVVPLQELPTHQNERVCRGGIRAFVEAIMHGDESHRVWLRRAAECFVHGEEIPPGVPNRDAAFVAVARSQLRQEKFAALRKLARGSSESVKRCGSCGDRVSVEKLKACRWCNRSNCSDCRTANLGPTYCKSTTCEALASDAPYDEGVA